MGGGAPAPPVSKPLKGFRLPLLLLLPPVLSSLMSPSPSPPCRCGGFFPFRVCHLHPAPCLHLLCSIFIGRPRQRFTYRSPTALFVISPAQFTTHFSRLHSYYPFTSPYLPMSFCFLCYSYSYHPPVHLSLYICHTTRTRLFSAALRLCRPLEYFTPRTNVIHAFHVVQHTPK